MIRRRPNISGFAKAVRIGDYRLRRLISALVLSRQESTSGGNGSGTSVWEKNLGGNAGSNDDSTPRYPSNYYVVNVIAVAAINKSGGLAS
jgi:hypothetical protein